MLITPLRTPMTIFTGVVVFRGLNRIRLIMLNVVFTFAISRISTKAQAEKIL